MIKKYIIIAVVILALGIVWAFIRGPEDTWLCRNGEWVKHGVPSAPKPTEPCGQAEEQTDEQKDEETGKQTIIVSSPQPNQIVKSPLIIEGEAGGWFFEACFSVKLLDDKGEEIAASYVQTFEDWMTEDFLPFKGTIEFSPPVSETGTLVLQKANPSDLPKFDEEFRVPVRFEPVETMKVKVYFSHSKLDPEVSCYKVFSAERQVVKTQAIARAALEELLKGPTATEQEAGFSTSINQGVEIQKLVIENGVAKVDFSEQLEYQVGGSCRVTAISVQITETLKQFPTVEEVIISINGRTEYILQP